MTNKLTWTVICLIVIITSMYFLCKNLMDWTPSLQIQNSLSLTIFALGLYGLGMIHYSLVFDNKLDSSTKK